jgi:ferritin|tara:strand:+ start:44 stop:511 length:468 start_codon:yes stop_codon:yes gene_type:complete
MKQKIIDELNKQVNAELYSAYLYLSMSAHFESKELKGMSHWMKKQAGEEIEHAMKLYDYVAKNGRVILTQINAPPTEWASPLAIFKSAYSHEVGVTGLINNLVKIAESEGDNETKDFLQWYVKEQIEEEESADRVVQELKNNKDISRIDNELSKR